MRFAAQFKTLLVFASLIATTYWFYTQHSQEHKVSRQAQPQEYMREIKTTTYNLHGSPKEVIYASYWEFNTEHECSEISGPRVVVYKDNGEIWKLTANKAHAWHRTVQDKISKVDMLDGVTVERVEVNTQTPIVLETKTLHYVPSMQKISTDDFVTMRQPGLLISGYGLLGYLDKNWVELHDQITTFYTAH